MPIQEIRELLKARYGLENASVESSREGGNTYIVTGPGKYLLKVIGKAFNDTARQSASVMRYLEKNGFPVPKTVLTVSGDAILEAPSGGEDRLMILQEFIDGKEPDLEKTASEVGALVGRLHCLLEKYPAAPVVRDKQFFIGRYLDFLRQKAYPRLSEYEELGGRLWDKVRDLPVGVCHGDLHRGNLLETADGQIYIIDFDTVCRAPFMFDVMVICDMTNYFELKQKDIDVTNNVYNRFLSGYSGCRSLSSAEELSFPYWTAVRHFQLQATILEMYGIDCIDERFIDSQLTWLNEWSSRAKMF